MPRMEDFGNTLRLTSNRCIRVSGVTPWPMKQYHQTNAWLTWFSHIFPGKLSTRSRQYFEEVCRGRFLSFSRSDEPRHYFEPNTLKFEFCYRHTSRLTSVGDPPPRKLRRYSRRTKYNISRSRQRASLARSASNMQTPRQLFTRVSFLFRHFVFLLRSYIFFFVFVDFFARTH